MQSNTPNLDALKQSLSQISAKHYKEVHSQALDMIKANVNDAVPYCLLGVIAAEHQNHIKACELFERATQLAPQSAYYHAYYGQALTTLGHQNQAKAAADKAAQLNCDDAFINDTIGVIYSRTGFHEHAIPCFEKAVSLNPAPANFHYNLAASQQFLGDFKRAEAAYYAALKRDPDAYRAWSSLVALERQSAEKNHLETLINLFHKLKSDEDAALHLGHAIAKTLEDLERYEDSLDWLHKAKKAKRAHTQAVSLTDQALFAAAKKTAKPHHRSKINSVNGQSVTPIFIIGLPRTGTTLVDRIVSSHSDVTSAGELNIFPGLIKEATQTPSNMVMDAVTFERSSELDLNSIGQAYIKNSRDLARGTAYFTDKMPLNFFYAGLIHQALPNARIIALRRGAMDSCLSNYRQLLTVEHSYYHYTYDLKDTAEFYRSFDDLMNHWRAVLPSNRFMEVHYEDIVLNQEQQTRRLLDFCDLDWQEACLRFHENDAPVATASSVQVRQPLYSGSIGRWQRYGDKLDSLKQALGSLAE